MPRPLNERQALEQELAELPVQIAVYLRELTETPEGIEHRAGRRSTTQAERREVQRRAVACSRDRRRRALDRRRAAPAHPGGLAAAGDDPDRLCSADAALVVVLL